MLELFAERLQDGTKSARFVQHLRHSFTPNQLHIWHQMPHELSQLFVNTLKVRKSRQLSQNQEGPFSEESPHHFSHLGVFRKTGGVRRDCYSLRGMISSGNAPGW